jgi:hypothetical protein
VIAAGFLSVKTGRGSFESGAGEIDKMVDFIGRKPDVNNLRIKVNMLS